MPLEATMIVVDNSESSRNGDYVPSRWDAQSDAVNLVFRAKTDDNPESSVGLMSMGGKGPEMLVTLTTDFGKVLEGMHRTKIRGHAHLATGIQVAGLALKHRQNPSQRQRIIVFVCSQIHEDEATLVKLAKKMRKNNVSVDFVAFGDLDPSNIAKLEAFNQNVKSGDDSNLAQIPPGPNLLSDSLLETPILGGSGQRGGAGGAGDAGEATGDASGGFEYGVDPSADPELALALRMSMEEEKARIERENKSKEGSSKDAMDTIPEEGGETQPLLEGQEEGSSSKSKGKDDDDKMDTA